MKTVCVYHSVDLDGKMSAATAKHWFEQSRTKFNPNKPESSGVKMAKEVIFNTINFIGYNYGQPIPDLLEYDKVIMCDVSFSNEEMLKLANRLGVNFIWIDHHQPKINEVSKYLVENKAPAIDGLTTIEGNTKYAACELTWQHFFPNESIPEIVRLLGKYDCFRHIGTKEEKLVFNFQYGARTVIENYEDAYYWLLRELEENCDSDPETLVKFHLSKIGFYIFEYLCKEAKYIYKNGFDIIFFEDSGGEKTIGEERKKFICVNSLSGFNPPSFGIDYEKDGYDGAASFSITPKGTYKLSLRSYKVDCNKIAKQFGGGGHKGAAGFECDYNIFKNLILSN